MFVEELRKVSAPVLEDYDFFGGSGVCNVQFSIVNLFEVCLQKPNGLCVR